MPSSAGSVPSKVWMRSTTSRPLPDLHLGRHLALAGDVLVDVRADDAATGHDEVLEAERLPGALVGGEVDRDGGVVGERVHEHEQLARAALGDAPRERPRRRRGGAARGGGPAAALRQRGDLVLDGDLAAFDLDDRRRRAGPSTRSRSVTSTRLWAGTSTGVGAGGRRRGVGGGGRRRRRGGGRARRGGRVGRPSGGGAKSPVSTVTTARRGVVGGVGDERRRGRRTRPSVAVPPAQYQVEESVPGGRGGRHRHARLDRLGRSASAVGRCRRRRAPARRRRRRRGSRAR